MIRKLDISFIGAGNVSWHLCQALAVRHRIRQIYSRTRTEAEEIARLVKAEAVGSIAQLDKADLVVLAVSDDSLSSVCRALPGTRLQSTLLVHSSGSRGLEVFPEELPRTGIFYPLNTFTKGVPMELGHTPFFLDAGGDADLELLFELAGTISKQVYIRNEEEMPFLHLSAVFANNFTNHMIALSKAILEERDIPFDRIRPLIQQTFIKISYLDPQQAQTGPAVRKDNRTMDAHLTLLDDEQKRVLYKLISRSISGEGKS